MGRRGKGGEMEGLVTQKLLELEVVTLTRAIFEQIEAPGMVGKTIDEVREEAAEHAFAVVIDGGGSAWLIIEGEKRLWRWEIMPARQLTRAESEFPWLGDLQQVFLVKGRRKKK